MGVVPLKDRLGIAGLFDALIFLAVASLVSVSLIATLSAHVAPVERERGSSSPHRTSPFYRERFPRNPSTVEELFKLRGQVMVAKSMSRCARPSAAAFRMEMVRGTREHRWAFGSKQVPNGDVICSIFSPIDGQEVTYRLEAWPLR